MSGGGGGTGWGINCTPATKYDLFTAGLRFYLKFIFKSIRPLKLLKGFQPANLFINIFSAECLREKKENPGNYLFGSKTRENGS